MVIKFYSIVFIFPSHLKSNQISISLRMLKCNGQQLLKFKVAIPASKNFFLFFRLMVLFFFSFYFMSKVYDWFEERLEIQSIADDITSKYVPPHVNIFYCLGGITFTCFLVQVATGFAMTFYYRPTVAEAFASVQYIMTEVNFGWLIRSIHRWSASMMVLMMILHVFRVYLTGGFKKPRESTWISGVIMAVCTVSFGVTGYSLPYDQIGYWAVKIVTGVPEAIPGIGGFLVELLRGGVGVGQATLTRFYSLHTFVLPLLTAVFMLAHFLMIRKQGISGPL